MTKEKVFMFLFQTGQIYMSEDGKFFRYRDEFKPAEKMLKSGYMSVYVTFQGKRYDMLSHRLVFLIVNDFLPAGKVIHHINANRADNRPQNLSAVTQKTNLRLSRQFYKYRKRNQYGSNNANAKLSFFDIIEIRKMKVLDGLTHKTIAEKFNISTSTVHRVMNKLVWIGGGTFSTSKK